MTQALCTVRGTVYVVEVLVESVQHHASLVWLWAAAGTQQDRSSRSLTYFHGFAQNSLVTVAEKKMISTVTLSSNSVFCAISWSHCHCQGILLTA